MTTTAKELKCLNRSHPIDEDNYRNVFNLYSKMHTTVKKLSQKYTHNEAFKSQKGRKKHHNESQPRKTLDPHRCDIKNNLPNKLIYNPTLHGEETRADSSTLAAFPWFEDTDNYNGYYN